MSPAADGGLVEWIRQLPNTWTGRTVRFAWRWRYKLAPAYAWLLGLLLGAVGLPRHPAMRWALVIGWTVLSVAAAVWWYRSRWYRGRTLLARYRRRLARTRLGEGGARIISLTVLNAGVRMRIRLGDRQSFPSVSRDDMAHDLDVPVGALTFEKDPKTGRMVTVRILHVDRFAGPEIPHPATSSPAEWRPLTGSILRPVPIGVTREDEPAELHLYRGGDVKHGALYGKTGSGKSNVLNVITAHIARCADAVLWVSDAPKSGATFRPWESVIAWAAWTAEETERQMIALKAVVAARSAIVARSDSDKWRPSPKRPAIVYVIEEFAALAGSRPDLAELATELVLTGRQAGVLVVVSSQGATWESVPTRLRDQLEWVVALKMANANLKQAWPGALGVIDFSLFDVPGLLYLNDGGGLRAAEGIVPARSFALYDPPARRALAALYGPHRPVLDKATADAVRAALEALEPVDEPAPATSRSTSSRSGVAARLAAARSDLEATRTAVDERSSAPVQLPLDALDDVFARVPAELGPEPDDDVTDRVLEALRNAPAGGLAKSDLAATVGTSPETALRRLTRLRAEGRARTTGKGSRTRWHLVQVEVSA